MGSSNTHAERSANLPRVPRGAVQEFILRGFRGISWFSWGYRPAGRQGVRAATVLSCAARKIV